MPLGGRSLRPTSIHIPPWPRFRPDAGFPSRPYLRGGAPTGPVAGAPPATCGTWGAYGYPGPAGTMTDVLTFRSRSRDRIACTIWGERNTLFVDRKAGRALFYQTFETSLPRGPGWLAGMAPPFSFSFLNVCACRRGTSHSPGQARVTRRARNVEVCLEPSHDQRPFFAHIPMGRRGFVPMYRPGRSIPLGAYGSA